MMTNNNECDNNQKRKPGAQPGNINALKHGRYSRLVNPNPNEQLPDLLSASLEEEISMLRSATRRTFELADQETDIDQLVKALGALGLASIRTSRLLKAQQELGDGDQALGIILHALNEVLTEWGRE
jgi:hypothetical protein